MEQTESHPTAATARTSLGRVGEQLAAEHLTRLGYTVLDRNWRHGKTGELDLVVRDGECIVAVEVKTRGGTGYGSPFAAITAEKAQRLRHLLHAWVRAHQPGGSALRIDAIGITKTPGEPTRIEHLRGIS